MRTYDIAIANTYNALESPLIINAGYYNEKMSGYECITKLTRAEYEIVPFTSDLINIDNITVMTNVQKSYTVFLYDYSQSDNPPIDFSFYAFQNLYTLNAGLIEFILTQELPAIINTEDPLVAINMAGNVAVLNRVYTTCYKLFYDVTTSIGTGLEYNKNWEYVYLGVNNLLQNAKFPAQFIKTLMNINTQCSTQAFSMAITISRLTYQFIGSPVPVQVVYDNGLGGYFINIYYNIPDVWSLGTAGFSELGDTTYLLNAGTSYLWVINKIIGRLMPAFVKWQIQYLSRDIFNTDFDIADVNTNDFYNPDVLYNAYMVINNNNNFNTQGYNLNG